MANRYLRDSFPAEWVIQCALETGVSLLWLTTGQGEPGSNIDPNLLLVTTSGDSYLIDRNQTPPVNGTWLVDIDGIKSIVKLTRLPGNRLVVHQDDSSFECELDDIKVIGRALKIIKSL